MNALLSKAVRTQWSGILAGVIIGGVALSFASPAFLTQFNWFVMLRSICVSLLVAYSQMVMLGVGQLNLSVGSLGGLVAILAGGMMETLGIPTIPALIIAVLIGGVAGLVNGWLTVRTGINGFVVTLATGSAFAGINLGITKATPFYNMPADFVAFGNARLGLFPMLLVVPLLVTGLLALFFSRTRQGRYMLAVGGNSHAAALSGVSVARSIITAHMLSALLAAMAGVLAVAQLGSAQPTIGVDWLVISFAAPIIGGASLAGGSISIPGTLIAVMLIGLIQNAMVLLAVDPYWVTFLLGALILSAVWVNRARAVGVGKLMLLELRQVDKSFPGVRALKEASLGMAAGEIHALMGENGAGKSTLIKVVTGVYRPDGGEMLLDGKGVSLASPRDAMSLGISVVHQERNLIPRFSVAENILLERLPTRHGLVDFAQANREVRRHLELVGLHVDPAIEVRRLSVAQMQMVEIAKALSYDARVLLLDEPTASLTEGETETLLRLLRQLRDQGKAILFVSHKIEEVLSLCDRATVLRDGETTLRGEPVSQMTRATLIEAMIGRAERPALPRKGGLEPGEPRLELRGVSTAAGHRDISLQLRRGEILGLYGLVGAGRTELARALIGMDRITGGELLVGGKPVKIRSPENAIKRLRIGYVSEDRKYEGVVLAHSIRTNIAMAVWDRITSRLGVVTNAAELKNAAPLAQQLEIRAPSLEQLVGNLSGGNQQKVSLAKWLAADVDILIIDEPTVGIDIKTKAYIHELINGLADDGMAILLISSDLPEMVALADRIAVMRDFRIVHRYENDRQYDTASRDIMSAIHAGEAAA